MTVTELTSWGWGGDEMNQLMSHAGHSVCSLNSGVSDDYFIMELIKWMPLKAIKWRLEIIKIYCLVKKRQLKRDFIFVLCVENFFPGVLKFFFLFFLKEQE